MENFGINGKYIQTLSNAIARKNGFGFASQISFKSILKPIIGETTNYGYRKNSTGEYVPKAYINNFGWKNCYYQNSECEVILPLRYKAISLR